WKIRFDNESLWYRALSSRYGISNEALRDGGNDRVATKDNLSRRGVIGQGSLLCVGECGLEESVSHLFFECPVFAGIWYRIDRVSVIWFASIWCIWKARNDKLFKNKEDVQFGNGCALSALPQFRPVLWQLLSRTKGLFRFHYLAHQIGEE
ncbi:hypothetical protein A2U01_0005420, partial [Trifolium medium]|nr:hypothetical protein [Trifolium medium]